MNDAELKSAIALARRKDELLAHGALLRAQLTLAKHEVTARLRPESLMKNAFNQVLATAFALFKHRASLKAGGLPRFVPLVVSGVAMLSRKGWLKPLFKVGLVLASVGAVAGLALRARKIAADRRADRSL